MRRRVDRQTDDRGLGAVGNERPVVLALGEKWSRITALLFHPDSSYTMKRWPPALEKADEFTWLH